MRKHERRGNGIEVKTIMGGIYARAQMVNIDLIESLA